MLQTCTNRDVTFKKVQKTNILKADGDTAISDIIFSDKDQVSQCIRKQHYGIIPNIFMKS